MYKVIKTTGNNEEIIAEFPTLDEAKAKAMEIQKTTPSLITVEKDGRIY